MTTARRARPATTSGFFFFSSRRRHTRSTRDWSSDVCSSDLYSRRAEDRPVAAWHEDPAGRAREPGEGPGSGPGCRRRRRPFRTRVAAGRVAGCADGPWAVRFLLRPRTGDGAGGDRKRGEAVPNARKVAEVEAIKGYLNGSVAALLTEYRGLKVKEMIELRDSLRGSSTEYRVLKNTLTGIAVRDVGYEDLVPLLEGPTAVAFVHGDVVQAAKELAEFARTHPALVVKGGVLDGKVLDADSVRQLATLQSRDVVLARLAGMLQAPLQRTAVLLAAPLRQVATMTAALRDKLEESEGGAATEAE